MTGCTTTDRKVAEDVIEPAVNVERKAGIGELFFEHSVSDPRPFAYPSRFSMRVKELNDKEFVLEYTESKTYTFSTTDEVIRLKGYEFEILSIEKGKIIYRRIK
jgi:hypothetical protein